MDIIGRQSSKTFRAFQFEQHEKVYQRDDYMCRICGKSVHGKRGQKAHIIPDTKTARKLYGKYLLYHSENQLVTCGLDCNSAAMLGYHTEEFRAHVLKMQKIIEQEGLYEKNERSKR